MKKVLPLLLIIALLFCGCSQTIKENTNNSNAKEIITSQEQEVSSDGINVSEIENALEQKYNINFTLAEDATFDDFGNVVSYWYYEGSSSNRLTKAKVLAKASKENGQIYIKDNFVAYKYEEKTRNKLYDIANSVINGSTVYYSVNEEYILPAELNKNSSFEDYLTYNYNSLWFGIVTPRTENNQAKVEELTNMLKSQNINSRGAIVFTDNKNDFANVPDESFYSFESAIPNLSTEAEYYAIAS